MEEETPDKVLSRIYANLEKLKQNGDEVATKIQEKLRIIVSQIIININGVLFLFLFFMTLQAVALSCF